MNTIFNASEFIQSLEEELGPIWEFYEPDASLDWLKQSTVPGRLLDYVSNNYSSAAVGLLIAYCARRSLAAWFEYCTDTAPLEISNSLIRYWLGGQIDDIPRMWTQRIAPTEQGVLIVDCRRCDTSLASSAVAHAAKYARKGDLFDAIVSLSHADGAFDSSPVGSPDVFQDWLARYAIPNAISKKAMSYSDAVALADFPIPEPMKNRI